LLELSACLCSTVCHVCARLFVMCCLYSPRRLMLPVLSHLHSNYEHKTQPKQDHAEEREEREEGASTGDTHASPVEMTLADLIQRMHALLAPWRQEIEGQEGSATEGQERRAARGRDRGDQERATYGEDRSGGSSTSSCSNGRGGSSRRWSSASPDVAI
jgi:hypothetical protein